MKTKIAKQDAAKQKTLFFKVDLPESLPVATVATASGAIAAILGVGLLFYFKKRKH
jgi:LPXTG-motif cell wall-anchored protein